MKKLLQGLALAAAVGLSGCASLPTNASSEETHEYVSIPFADLGNIRDWRAYTSDALYVQSQNGQWYHITLWATCPQLRGAFGIAFVTDATGDLDRFSSILVRGDRCWFKTFKKSPPPTPPDDQDQS